MYMLIVFGSLIVFGIVILFGWYIGKRLSVLLLLFNSYVIFMLSVFCYWEVGLSGYIVVVRLNEWINSGDLLVYWGFLFDTLSMVVILVVTFISFMVHLFSLSYMKGDVGVVRFISFLTLFVFFMLVLVTADNFLQMFLGWEGVGMVSYLLINFWYMRYLANRAALKAMLVNRLADMGLLLGMIIIYLVFGTLDYCVVDLLGTFMSENIFIVKGFKIQLMFLIGFCIFVGIMGKSAQFGFHEWLPDAMEGPTPVSALIHAATMVAAGVFLLVRCSFIFSYCSDLLLVVFVIGGMTAVYGALVACFANDVKKIIAYSTCSHLGLMVMVCGCGSFSYGLTHLFNHAIYKALLFLSAGALIHLTLDQQDLRKMGGMMKICYVIYFFILMGSLSMMGFFFLTGYYSKEMVLLNVVANQVGFSGIGVWFISVFSVLSVAYSGRFIYRVFGTLYNGNMLVVNKVVPLDVIMFIVLYILVLCSTFVGYIFNDMFLGIGTCFWNNTIDVYGIGSCLDVVELEMVYFFIKIAPLYPFLSACLYMMFKEWIVCLEEGKEYAMKKKEKKELVKEWRKKKKNDTQTKENYIVGLEKYLMEKIEKVNGAKKIESFLLKIMNFVSLIFFVKRIKKKSYKKLLNNKEGREEGRKNIAYLYAEFGVDLSMLYIGFNRFIDKGSFEYSLSGWMLEIIQRYVKLKKERISGSVFMLLGFLIGLLLLLLYIG